MPTNIEPPAAVIFDMDGVLVDSNPYHLAKWIDFLDERKIAYNRDELPELILGKRNDTAFRYFLGPDLTREESRRLSEEIEATFRRVFKAHAKPLPGLDRLIHECRAAGIPMAVASSAMRKNVEFVVDALGYRDFFKTLTSGDEVARPKPDPEIYLKTAERLGVEPSYSVAFEDSYPGVEAAKSAGMKCVGIASSFPILRLGQLADIAVPGFEQIDLQQLRKLFAAAAKP